MQIRELSCKTLQIPIKTIKPQKTGKKSQKKTGKKSPKKLQPLSIWWQEPAGFLEIFSQEPIHWNIIHLQRSGEIALLFVPKCPRLFSKLSPQLKQDGELLRAERRGGKMPATCYCESYFPIRIIIAYTYIYIIYTLYNIKIYQRTYHTYYRTPETDRKAKSDQSSGKISPCLFFGVLAHDVYKLVLTMYD